MKAKIASFSNEVVVCSLSLCGYWLFGTGLEALLEEWYCIQIGWLLEKVGWSVSKGGYYFTVTVDGQNRKSQIRRNPVKRHPVSLWKIKKKKNKNHFTFLTMLQISAANLFFVPLGEPCGANVFECWGCGGAHQTIIGRRAEGGSAVSLPPPPPRVGGGGGGRGWLQGREGRERETFRRANIFKVTRWTGTSGWGGGRCMGKIVRFDTGAPFD